MKLVAGPDEQYGNSSPDGERQMCDHRKNENKGEKSEDK
jgi:hypothetical protein